jgi:NADH-quinone oxidoreductase subunit N
MLTYLAIFAALNAAVGVFYYLRVVVAMYLKASDEPAAIVPPVTAITPWPLKFSIIGCLAGTIIVGLFPATVSLPAQRSAVSSLRLPVQKPALTAVAPNTGAMSK